MWLVLCGALLISASAMQDINHLFAQGSAPPPNALEKPWAEIVPQPGKTIVVLRDTNGADQAIITTFYRQKIKGLSEAVVLSVTDVIGAVKDVPVGAMGAPNPNDVIEVHVSLAKITHSMSWNPPPTPAGK